jgi:quinol monooxygenase YgiN
MPEASPTSTPFCVTTRIVVKPAFIPQFLKVIKENRDSTLSTESSALQFLVMQDTRTAHQFFLHEEYTSKSSFFAHMETPHFSLFSKFMSDSDPFESIMEVNQFVAKDETSDVTKEAREYTSIDTISSKYCVLVTLHPQASSFQSFMTVINNNKVGTDTTEGSCYQYTYGENDAVSRKGAYHFFEVYEGEEGFHEHCGSEHFKAWEEFAKNEPFTKPPEVYFARVI